MTMPRRCESARKLEDAATAAEKSAARAHNRRFADIVVCGARSVKRAAVRMLAILRT